LNVQFTHTGYLPMIEMHSYIAFAASGVVRDVLDEDYVSTGTVLDLPDHQWQVNSVLLASKCDKCGLEYEAYSCPGGKLVCPLCGTEEPVPADLEVELDDED